MSSASRHSSSSPSQPRDRLTQLTGQMDSAVVGNGATATSFGDDVCPQAPEDPLFGLMAAYRKDSDPNKVDLGIGAYRDDNAKPWVLPVVTRADQLVRADPDLNHEYLPIAGLADFVAASQKLLLGPDSPAIREKRTVSLQSISGTGALHLGALFLARFYKPASAEAKTVLLSDPTWANHKQIFGNVLLPTATYPYFHPASRGLDIDGMLAALGRAPQGSVVLLHACAHNPTGVDPTQEQWKSIARVMRERRLFPFFDTAYQGFASGSLSRDAWAIRYFVELGFEMLIAQSYAKNFGLYGERAGCLHFVTSPSSSSAAHDAPAVAARVGSQLAVLQRSEISNPPAHGARLAAAVLADQQLFAAWEEDLRTMSGRIIAMRSALRSNLERLQTPGTWKHITDQIGMFSFTGLSPPQVRRMRDEFHVYMTSNGRISMAGLNSRNVEYVARAVDQVVRG